MTALIALEKSLPIISKVAPFIATMLGGPVAGTAITVLESIFGHENLDTTIASDPDVEVKLIRAEAALRKVDEEDKANARQRELELVKSGGKHDWFLVTLALLVVIAFFASIGATIFMHIDDANKETIHYLQDTLGNTFVMILSYYFGTSHNERSRNK